MTKEILKCFVSHALRDQPLADSDEKNKIANTSNENLNFPADVVMNVVTNAVTTSCDQLVVKRLQHVTNNNYRRDSFA